MVSHVGEDGDDAADLRVREADDVVQLAQHVQRDALRDRLGIVGD